MKKNKSLFFNKKRVNENLKLSTIYNIVKRYNSLLFKYTGSYIGSLPTPKLESNKIPKKYLSINEYLKSKPEWRNILRFTKEVNDVIIDNYLDVMMRNWNNIALAVNIDLKKPLYSVIFSPKIVFLYHEFNRKEEISNQLNKQLGITNTEDFYRLTPSLQNNINSLFRLKRINPTMSYFEIVDIFIGEFDDEFIEKIKQLSGDEISEDNLYKIFN